MSGGASDAHNGPKIGRSLELARKEQGLSLKQVEEATKIRAGYLEELERENFDVMPAVYVQGSLKTYANFLQLDGEALVRELKRRQEPVYAEFEKDATQDHPTIPLGAAAVVEDQGTMEEDAGSTLIPAGIVPYLYLVAGALLVLVAVALVLMIPAGDERPAVSQVREPLISQAPTGATPDDTGEDESAHQPLREGKERGSSDKGDDHKPERSNGSSGADTRGTVRTADAGQDRDTSSPERSSRGAAATHSASPTPEPASAEPETAEPETAEPETAEPETASTPSPAAEEPGSPGNRARRPPSDSREDKDFDVRIAAGSDDPVRITGGVPAMDDD